MLRDCLALLVQQHHDRRHERDHHRDHAREMPRSARHMPQQGEARAFSGELTAFYGSLGYVVVGESPFAHPEQTKQPVRLIRMTKPL